MKDELLKEIAIKKRSIDFYSLGINYLPNPDPILKKQGKDIKVYQELLLDSVVSGCISSRKAGVLSLEWAIDRGKAPSRLTKFVEAVLKDLDLYTIMESILNAPLFGYSVMEVLWEKKGSYIVPKAVIEKPQSWFSFSEDNSLRLRTKENPYGEPLPDRKFLLVQHSATYENPYGFPILSRCFWPATFKKGGLKFWITFTEKYGMPFLLGKQPRGTSKEETERFAELLENMIQDAIAVIPDDSSVEILKLEARAGADIYQALIDYCDSQIAIAILGQNLTTKVEKGSYAAAKAHMEVRHDIIEADKRLVEKAINKLIRWIVEINFSSQDLPTFTLYEERDINKDLAERDRILKEVGVKFSKRYFVRTYGFEEEDIEVEEKGPPLEFSEPEENSLELEPEEMQSLMEKLLRPIFELLKETRDYDEVFERLFELYPQLSNKELEELLTKALFLAELWGVLDG